jgi:hypothetical protein
VQADPNGALESSLWLRQGYGLSLRQTRETLAELSRTVFADSS